MQAECIRGALDKPVMAETEKDALLEEYARTQDPEIKKRIVEGSLRLVRYMVRKYRRPLNPACDDDDLFQWGVIGLMSAIDRYNSELGTFSTYSTWWIYQAMSRNLDEQGNIVRIPGHMLTDMQLYRKTFDRLESEMQRKPTRKEIAVTIKMPEDKVERIEILSNQVLSLDYEQERQDQEEGNTFLDTLEDPSANFQQAVEDKVFFNQTITFFKETLTQEELTLIVNHYGLLAEPKAISAVARDMGLLVPKAKAIRQKALMKIRTSDYVKELRPYVESYVDARTQFVRTQNYSGVVTKTGSNRSTVEDSVMIREGIRNHVIGRFR